MIPFAALYQPVQDLQVLDQGRIRRIYQVSDAARELDGVSSRLAIEGDLPHSLEYVNQLRVTGRSFRGPLLTLAAQADGRPLSLIWHGPRYVVDAKARLREIQE